MSDPITRWEIEPHPYKEWRAFLLLGCNRSSQMFCRFPLHTRPAVPESIWSWDGNFEKPTISPSIQCNNGCGRHFTMTKGQPV